MIALAFEERDRWPLAKFARLFGFSRTDFYRQTTRDRDRLLRDAIHAIALDWPAYGYRTITHELRRNNWVVNEKRVRRIMCEENLVRPPSKRRGLPYRRHHNKPYPNLTRDLAVERIDQLWVADFTYVRYRGRFIFVAFLVDAFSRRCLGWSIAPHFRGSLIIGALQMALATRVPPSGFIHHSDRGGEYFDTDYLDVLRDHGAQISMSRAATPSDNAKIERFIRTIKSEEIYLREYADFDEASRSIVKFIHRYNHRRLHSRLGYRPPVEFERICQEPKTPVSA
jgi:transposase InsO family protein